MPRLKVLLLSLATLSATAFGQNANPARPGTLNYVEGQASIEGRPLSTRSIGNTELQAGQTIATANGKAEVLLTPGVFLRLGNDSTVQMVSPNLTHTEVRIERGQAQVEVDQLFDQNRLLIDQANGQTQILKRGLYSFDAARASVQVFDGKANVYPGTDLNTDVKPVEIKGDRQFTLTGDMIKPQKFDKNSAEGDLYHWGSLRSEYLGQESANLSEEYADNAGYNPGWYWGGSPYGYAFYPGDGLFWGGYGGGFYSPYFIGGGGFYGGRGGYGRGGGYGPYHGGGAGFHGGGVAAGGFHGGGGGGGFHGGSGGGGGHR